MENEKRDHDKGSIHRVLLRGDRARASGPHTRYVKGPTERLELEVGFSAIEESILHSEQRNPYLKAAYSILVMDYI